MKWFRFYNDAIADTKLALLAFEDRWHYIAVLCMKSSGLLDSKKDELRERRIAAGLGLTLREADEVKRRLMEVSLVTETWQPTGWKKRQYEHDSSAERTRKYRERKKKSEVGGDENVTSQKRNSDADVTSTDTDTDTETDTENNKDDFDLFWSMYPKKTNKVDARKRWKKLSATDKKKIFEHLPKRKWPTDKQFILNPSTFLNGQRWEDEITSNQDVNDKFKGAL